MSIIITAHVEIITIIGSKIVGEVLSMTGIELRIATAGKKTSGMTMTWTVAPTKKIDLSELIATIETFATT